MKDTYIYIVYRTDMEEKLLEIVGAYSTIEKAKEIVETFSDASFTMTYFIAE